MKALISLLGLLIICTTSYTQIKISALPAATGPCTGCYVAGIQSGITKKILVDNIVLNKQNLVTLTTTGTSGAATFNQGTGALNIPAYAIGIVGIANGGTNQTSYTTGDILYASATNTLSKLPIGTPKQTLHVVSGVPAWRDTVPVISATKGTYIQRPASPDTGQIYWQTDGLEGRYEYDGFLWGFVGNPHQYIVNDQFPFDNLSNWPQHFIIKSGTGSAASAVGATSGDDILNKGHAGVWKLQTGTTSAGYSAITAVNSVIGSLDSMITYNEQMIRIPTLSTSGERYVLLCGINASYSPGSINSAYEAVFQYSDSLNSGNWSTFTSAGGALGTLKNTGVAATTGWVKLGVKSINYGTKKIEFYINDILVQTHTSPTDTGPFANSSVNYSGSAIFKTVGTANRTYIIDYSFTYKIK